MSNGAEEASRAIQRFLEVSREPVLQEPGERLLPLTEGRYALQTLNGRLTIEAWDDETNLVRRITGVKAERPGRLELTVERFGKKNGVVSLLDLARHGREQVERRAARLSFRETFRRFLRRQYPDWQIAELSTEPDLQHSLSPSYPRALLRRGTTALAAIGAAGTPEADGALTFGLIWLDYLRRRDPRTTVEGLAIFVPLQRAKNTCLRARYLDEGNARFSIFAHTEDGGEAPIDPRDFGNIDTRLDVCAPALRGAFAHTPEARLEAMVRTELETIHAALLPRPVYGQVPAFSGVDRGVLDLLAVQRDGQLAVIELKASEDLHLPVQALDYWLRVKWHAEKGDFGRHGYFPGTELRNDPPKLLLVAPAFAFHPSTETVLRFFSAEIDVERIGVAASWENGIRVMFRARGAQSPQT